MLPLLKLAIDAALKAGEEILSVYESSNFGVEMQKQSLPQPSIEEVFDGLKVCLSQTAQKTAQKNTRELIVELLMDNPHATIKEMKEKLSKADGTIKEHLARLKSEGIIMRQGGQRKAIGKC